MIEYRISADGLNAEQLGGFFQDWPNPPSPETHLTLLRRSDEVVIAVDTESDQVVGFVTALTDRVLSAYIPLLEVRSDFRSRGVGRQLVTHLLKQLEDVYMVDVVCDPEVQEFYERLGFNKAVGASIRRHENQDGIG